MARRSSKKTGRRSREQWLQEALLALSRDPVHLRVDEIAARLGVSKGSFYWHFKGRADFVKALAEYWAETETGATVREIQAFEGTPEEKLRRLMEILLETQPGRFDLPIRAWARIEPDIMPIVEQVDRVRFDVVGQIFADLGFDGPELSARLRAFAALYTFERFWTVALDKDAQRAELDARFELFTRR